LEFGRGIEQVIGVYWIPISAVGVAEACDVYGLDGFVDFVGQVVYLRFRAVVRCAFTTPTHRGTEVRVIVQQK